MKVRLMPFKFKCRSIPVRSRVQGASCIINDPWLAVLANKMHVAHVAVLFALFATRFFLVFLFFVGNTLFTYSILHYEKLAVSRSSVFAALCFSQ